MAILKSSDSAKQIKTSTALKSTIANAIASFTKAIETLNGVATASDEAIKAHEAEISKLAAENEALNAQKQQAISIVNKLNSLINE